MYDVSVREGFRSYEVCWRGLNKCVSVNVQCGRTVMRALVDTGCGVNIVFGNHLRSLTGIKLIKNDSMGSLKEIEEFSISIIGNFKQEIDIEGIKMKKN